ncbi:hypothetical protein UB45_10975 [Terrabacter sp. 28]|nr:hypothetical protein UB45_10975 [Terrabacter sp. 28]
MEGQIKLACQTLTVIHVRWFGTPGKYRRAIPRLAKVRWDDATSGRIYLPGPERRDEGLDWWVGALSDYAGAPLERIAAESLPFIRTRPEALKAIPSGCVAVCLGKWDTGIGHLIPGRLLSETETEAAWWKILSLIGPSAAWWQDYSPELYGFG